jgi:hypothetical protein
VLHLIELGEPQEACAKWLLEKAGKKSGQLVAGSGPDRDRGVRKERKRREVGPLATSTYYTISTLFVKVNLSIVVSTRWQSGGSATFMLVRNPGSRDVQTFMFLDVPCAAGH